MQSIAARNCGIRGRGGRSENHNTSLPNALCRVGTGPKKIHWIQTHSPRLASPRKYSPLARVVQTVVFSTTIHQVGGLPLSAGTCGVAGCRRKCTAEKCFGYKVLRCRNHTGMVCRNCALDAASVGAPADAHDLSCVPPFQHMVTCLAPSEGTTMFMGHYDTAPMPRVIEPGTTPKARELPNSWTCS